MESTSFHIKPVAPFRLDLTVWALRRRANNIMDRWEGKTYRRVLSLDSQAVDIAATQTGPQDDPELNIEVASAGLSPEDESTVLAIVERMLGTGQDLLEFYRLASEDAQLSQLAERYRGLKPPRFPTLFEAMVNGIACQQITLTLGIILLNRLATNYGMPVRAESSSVYAFPGPEDLAGLKPQDIRRLGLSYNKASAIIELARMITEGDLEDLESQDDETVLSRLCQLKGVGRWTAEYVMLRGLGRIHLFPGDDVGARKNLQRWLKLKEPMIIIVTKGDLQLIASIFNFGTLMTLFFINMSLLQLRRKMPEANRFFKVPLYPITPKLGLISCFALVFYLKANAIIAAGVWIALGVIAYEYNKRREVNLD